MQESDTRTESLAAEDESPCVSEGRSRAPKSLVFAAAAILYLPIVAAVLFWLHFYTTVEQALAQLEGRWADVIPYDSPEFWSSFHEGIELYLSRPRVLVRWLLTDTIALFLTVGLMGLGLYWRVAAHYRTTKLVRWLPVTAPLWMGLALYPQAVFRSFQALAEVGLTSPPAVGAGLGETTYLMYVGLLAALASVVVALWLGYRDTDASESLTR